jgi:hypothetical protein
MFFSLRPALLSVSLGLSTLALAPSVASATIINFDGRAHGQVVDHYYEDRGVTISAANFQGGPHLAIAFDTNRQNTDDADLEFNWSKGNLVGTLLNKVLIVAENDIDANRDGRVDRPDDQGSEPHLGSSGQITFEFAQPQQSFGLDLIDVEDGDFSLPPSLPPQAALVGDQVGFIAFYLRDVEIRRVSLGDFINPSSPFYDRTVQFADNSANRIQPMSAEELNIIAFDQVVVDMGMCYAIDNLQFETFQGALPNLPEPSSLAVLGLGVIMLAKRRRR